MQNRKRDTDVQTDFWTLVERRLVDSCGLLWEKARVGCFERTACILSIVKQITSPGGMNEKSAQAWRTGKTQRNQYIMKNARLDEAQARIKITRKSINNLRYADDITLVAESEKYLKSILMKVKGGE